MDALKTDLRLVFATDDEADLDVGINDIDTVSGMGNLVQALKVRLLIDKGELTGLGHPRFGSRIREVIGETQTPASFELVRRYVRQTLLEDPRVAEVSQIKVEAKGATGDAFNVRFCVLAVTGGEIQLQVSING